MYSKDKAKKISCNWPLVRCVLATLLVFFMPFLIGQFEWMDKPWSTVSADDNEGGNNNNNGNWEGERLRIAYHTPPNAQADVKPRSMIVISNDHQLFFKAYTDFSDLDGDGEIDDTYKGSIRYYGYFDSEGCYVYDSSLAGGAFKRDKDTDDNFECNGNRWSGNFLNWATMTRMDVLRKVLYGGKRYPDNSTQSTILERASLPLDAHSFAKVIANNNAIKLNTPFNYNEITICNTTASLGGPPLIRVAKGSEEDKQGWPNWSANERWQCVWSGEKAEGDDSKRPEQGNNKSEYRVRVEVCTGTEEKDGCSRYPNGNLKPTGLLHQYAKNIEFALMTGSYAKSTQGGVLRANMRSFNEEVDLNTGIFKNVNGIVSNVDAFRISRYDYGSGTYNYTDNCMWGTSYTDVGGGKCSSWGNPFAEITAEALKYLAGEPRTTEFSVGTGDNVESDFIQGLSSPEWDNNSGAAWCAAHSMILINSSEASFDSDDLDNIVLRGGGTVKSWTNEVAAEEGIAGQYFVGVSGADDNRLCTAKTVNSGNFGNVSGICPGAPGIGGSYNVAGLAKYAHDTPIIRSNDNSQGSNVSTYAVRLSANTPIVDLGDAKIIPACENTQDNGRCSIVDFRSQTIGDNSGSFDITWEDSEFGGDYDSDYEMAFAYVRRGNRLTITTDVVNDSSGRTAGVGYVLSGTNGRYKSADSDALVRNNGVIVSSDGFVAHSGVGGYSQSLCDEGCSVGDSSTTQSYRIGDAGGATSLKPPLYYAAKYGNDEATEAYFEVGDISQLASSLQNILDEVLNSADRTGAGLGYSTNVEGFVYQTLYNNIDGWSGDVVAFKTNSSGVDKEAVWSARDSIPDSRTIITWNAENDTGAPFQHDDKLEGFTDDQPSEEEVSYMRALSLGDIIDSKPFVVGKPDSYYVPGSADDTSYLDFISDYQDRTPMVYVGANDGMLHGFDANSGVEKLAYVPGLLIDSIGELADPDYEHRFYVDGSPMVFDARFGGDWHSVLASGLGAGGRGLFALDVTDPSKFTEANADQIALFEYGPSSEQSLFGGDDEDSHLGYIYGPPSIVQMENNEYAVVFGNGYFSDSGKAVLYIIYLDGAADGSISNDDVIRLVPGGSANDGGNGLSTVSLVDRDRNGQMDTAYAGDLQGNLWRFDLSDEDGSDWEAPIKPLFTSRQTGGDDEEECNGEDGEGDDGASPVITTGVAVGRDPELGIMLFFGTGTGTGGAPGRGIPTSEERGAIDAFYAVPDVVIEDPEKRLPLDRCDLRKNPLEQQRSDSQGNTTTLRYFDDGGGVSDNGGWYMDFLAGERVVDTPLLQGELITFGTLIPGLGFCGAEDEGYLYKLNAFSGMAFDAPVLDINEDGVINNEDMIDVAVDVGGGEVVPVAIKTEGSIFTPTPSGDTVNTQAKLINVPPLSMPTGQVSWRELVN